MTLDLRDSDAEEYRERLFALLSDATAGEEFEVVADEDIDPHLVRYQREHDRRLEWEHDHPDATPREHHVTVGEPLDDDALGTIDVRDLKPQRRHESLLQIFDELDAGEGFVLINDHDPKPLYHQFQAEEGPEFYWEYRQQEPGEFTVLTAKSKEPVDEPTGTEVESPF